MPEIGERVQGTVLRFNRKLVSLETFLGSDWIPVELRLAIRALDIIQKKQLAVGKVVVELEQPVAPHCKQLQFQLVRPSSRRPFE